MSTVTFAIPTEDGRPLLRMGSGDYTINQRVRLEPGASYHLSARLRTSTERASLRVRICPKNILYSERWAPRCVRTVFRPPVPGEWTDFQWEFESGELARYGWLSWPTTLMLANGSKGPIDIAELRLTDDQGRALIANGDFSRGFDRWFFASDFEHLAWHAKNIFLHTWLEQGWLGLLALSLALTVAAIRQARAALDGNLIAPALLSTLAGLGVVGLFDSVLDHPRVAMLFYLGLFASLHRTPPVPWAAAPALSGTDRTQARPT